MSERRCAATSQRGQPCRSEIVGPSGYCTMHDPAKAEQLAEARSRGALNATKLRALQGRCRKLDTASGLIRFVSEVVQDCLEEKVEPDVARVALYGVSIQRQLIETGEIERRLVALEQRLPASGRSWWA